MGCALASLDEAALARQAILENALDLDAGRYVRGGSSSTILYAIRLAIRVGSYIRYLLSPKAANIRGLQCAPRASPRDSTTERRRHALLSHALPHSANPAQWSTRKVAVRGWTRCSSSRRA